MWTLIVLILGSNPPQGTIKYGFADKAACEHEALDYCPLKGKSEFRCKCEKGLVPPGTRPPPNPPLKR
jgi:hypothetical protein